MIITLSNGNTIVLDDITEDPRAGAIKWLRRRKEKAVEPKIETSTSGISAIFPDGAVVTFTVQGLFPCTHCDDGQCKHFHAALPHWNRYRWEMAEREDSPWGPSLLWSIGIVPPFIVRPDLVTSLSRWAPFGRGEEIYFAVAQNNEGAKFAFSVRMWHTVRGRLYRFGNEGHVYVGTDHPNGHTPCLICRSSECDHVERALELETQAAKK